MVGKRRAKRRAASQVRDVRHDATAERVERRGGRRSSALLSGLPFHPRGRESEMTRGYTARGLWKVTRNNAGLKIQLTPRRPRGETCARGRTSVSVCVCVRFCARLFFSIRAWARGLSVNCIASIKSLGERKRAKAQFWESQRQKLIVGQTDRLIDRRPLLQRVGRAIGHPICRQFVQKSTLQDALPVHLFFSRARFVSKTTKKEEGEREEKDRYCRNEGSRVRGSHHSRMRIHFRHGRQRAGG